jgi:putative ABC transport system permease protein
VAQAFLTYADYVALEKNLSQVSGISPAYTSNYTITSGVTSDSVSTIGVTEDYLDVRSYTLASGRNISANDRQKSQQVAVLGATTAETFFGTASPVGQKIKIDGKSYTVIGLLESKGSTGFDNSDDVILVPLETGYSQLFGTNAIRNGERIVSAIAVSAESAEVVDSVSAQITFIMRHTHKLDLDEEDDFRVSNQAALLETLSSVTGTMTAFLGAVAALSLLVGGIGIMNITLVSVSERTREIGLRKAVGARKDHILFQFLIETVTLSISGGVIGILLGILIAGIVTLTGLITAQVTISSILLSFLFSFAVGLFFGIYPAYRASNLHPMEALRSE